jgi:hypothetical protein
LLRGAHDAGVLHGVEIGFRVGLRVSEPLGQHVAELRNRSVLARIAFAAQDPVAVGLRLVLPRRKATIPSASDLRGVGIRLIEVAEYSVD